MLFVVSYRSPKQMKFLFVLFAMIALVTVQGKRGGKPEKISCVEDTDCVDDQMCKMFGEEGFCVRVPLECTNDSECGDGVCMMKEGEDIGVCKHQKPDHGEKPAECDPESEEVQCEDGYVCQSTERTEDRRLLKKGGYKRPAGICVAEDSFRRFLKKGGHGKPKGQQCTDDSECTEEKEVCMFKQESSELGFCRVPPFSCSDDSECEDGVCIMKEANGVCKRRKPCDLECEEGFVCTFATERKNLRGGNYEKPEAICVPVEERLRRKL